MGIYHVTLASKSRLAIARTETERRALMRVLVRTGGSRFLLPSLVDDHLHAGARIDRPGYLARDLKRILRSRRPNLELKEAHIQPVDTRSYLRWLVRYLLMQPAKHGLPGPPALWTGSCFQDLAGARLLEGFDSSALREELPRLRLRELFGVVGLDTAELCPATDEALRRAGSGRLAALAAGVLAVGPDLTQPDRSRVAVRARALAVHAGREVGAPLGELAHHLGVRRRTVRALLRRTVEPRALLALRTRFSLEERALGQRAA